MQSLTFVGFVAATLTTLSYVPQVHKAWRTRRVDDLSMGMLLSLAAGVALWIVYGVLLPAPPVIVANVLTLALIAVIVYLKSRYGSRPADRSRNTEVRSQKTHVRGYETGVEADNLEVKNRDGRRSLTHSDS